VVNALGIEITEWYHLNGLDLSGEISREYESRVVANTLNVLELLSVMETKATFFVLGIIAEKFPDLVVRIEDAGHEIASHGYLFKELRAHTIDSFREDLKKSIAILQGISKKPVVGYRAPGFSMNSDCLWAMDILKQEGISYDSSIAPVRHRLYGIPSAPRIPYHIREDLVEFPPSTVRILFDHVLFSGGAALRDFPYSLIKRTVENLNDQGIVVNFFLRAWELNPFFSKAKIPLSFRSEYLNGLEKTKKRFEQILTDFQCAPLSKIIQDKKL